MATLSQEVAQQFNALPNLYAPAGYGYGERTKEINGYPMSESEFYEALLNEASALGVYTNKLLRCYLPPSIDPGGNPYSLQITRLGAFILFVGYGHLGQRWSLAWRDSGVGWGKFMWDNPPLNLDVEYCTTEQYQGKPVYVKVVSTPGLTANSDDGIDHGISNIDDIVSCTGIVKRNNGEVNIPYIQYGGDRNLYTMLINATRTALIRSTSFMSFDSAIITLKYTKTTD